MRPAPLAARARHDECEPLRVAVGDDHALGVGHHATHPAEIAGQGRAQDGRPARIAVAELGIGHARQSRAQRPQPRRPREGREIGPARAEVEAHTRRRRRDVPAAALGGGGVAGNARTCALAQIQVPLGAELRVRIHHDAPRDAELAGQIARRRQLRPILERALADGGPELILDLGAQGASSTPGHRKQDLDRLTGLIQRPRTLPARGGQWIRREEGDSPSVWARVRVASTASTPAPPASAKAAAGPELSVSAPAAADPAAPPSRHRRAQPCERLGHHARRCDPLDHRVDRGERGREPGTGDEQHRSERDETAGRGDRRDVRGRESREHEREARGAARTASEPRREDAAGQRAQAPEAEQRACRRAAPERRSRCGGTHLDAADEHADGDEDRHQCLHRRHAQSPAGGARSGRIRPPRARGGLRREERGPACEQSAGDGQGEPGRQQRSDAERERRAHDPRQLDGGGLHGVDRRRRRGVVHERGQERAHACSEWRHRQPDGRREHDEHCRGGSDGQRGDCTQQRAGRASAHHEHARLPATVDELAEQRPADPERHGVHAGDDARRRIGAREVDRVNQERDGEHRQREAGDDRDDEDAQRAGARGQRFHEPDPRHALVSEEDPVSAVNMRPVRRLASRPPPH